MTDQRQYFHKQFCFISLLIKLLISILNDSLIIDSFRVVLNHTLHSNFIHLFQDLKKLEVKTHIINMSAKIKSCCFKYIINVIKISM